ncbi:hypothetical protein S1OALGB6SA_243 [Olavius algarvensis spirochete endosymbiont]|nr:hypothetical protein S1OALGB6SA_243 [Olavius algarvensis spirochete endosymbiont]
MMLRKQVVLLIITAFQRRPKAKMSYWALVNRTTWMGRAREHMRRNISGSICQQ